MYDVGADIRIQTPPPQLYNTTAILILVSYFRTENYRVAISPLQETSHSNITRVHRCAEIPFPFNMNANGKRIKKNFMYIHAGRNCSPLIFISVSHAGDSS
jgi:hypothetical protein